MTSSTGLVIELEGLRFRYPGPGHDDVLKISRFQVKKGERVFLRGPSGSGKTTLLGLISGVLLPTEGRVEVLGKDLAGLSSSARDRFRGDHLGYVFQGFNLIPYLSVGDNIELPARLSSEKNLRVLERGGTEEARRLAKALGVHQYWDREVTRLSVGQQQRVAAARALYGSPELVIADEPTSALDTDHREKFIRLLFAEAERLGSTVFFVSHDSTLQGLFSRTEDLMKLNEVASAAVTEEAEFA